MHWIESNGGPLILLQGRDVKDWGGTGGAEWEAGSGTDYDRACSVRDWVGPISVGKGEALILGGDPLPTAVVSQPRGAVLVRWMHAPEGWEAEGLQPEGIRGWEHAVTWEVRDRHVFIQDSAFRGLEADQVLALELSPGAHRVLTAEYRPDPDVSMVLHWIRPQS